MAKKKDHHLDARDNDLGPGRGRAEIIARRPLEGRKIPPKAILIAAIAVVLLYASHVNGRWRPSYDCSHYLILGRSIASGQGYTMNGQPDNVFPPGMAVLLAGVFATVGESFFVFDLLMVLFALAALALIYACLSRLTDPATALLVTVATALSYRFYTGSGRILTDLPTTMLFWLTLYICLRGLQGRGIWLAGAAVSAVTAVMFRIAGVLMMGALGVGIFLDSSLHGRWRRRLAAAVAVAVPALTTTLVLYALASQVADVTPRYETQMQDALGIHHNPIMAYGLRLAAIAGELPRLIGNLMTGQQFGVYGVVLTALVAAGMAVNAVGRRWLAPAMCILYPLGLVLVLETVYVVQTRMWFPIQPLLLLLALQGLTYLYMRARELLRREPNAASERKAVAILIALVAAFTLVPSVPRIFRDAFLNVYYAGSDRYYSKIKMPEVGAFLPLAEKAAELDSAENRILTGCYHEMKMVHYVSERLAVQWPRVDESDAAAEESARLIHLYATKNSEISTAILPLRYRIRHTLAWGIREAFDQDPAWRLVDENDFYALYHRDGSTSVTEEPPVAGDELRPATQASRPAR